MSAVFETLDELRQLPGLHQAVVVACSFGKDSLIALDLCCKFFQRVECLHMTYVPGLELTAKRCGYVRQRWGMTPHVVEHWGALEHRRKGYRCFPDDTVKRKTIKDIYDEAKVELNCSLIVTGTRAAEDIGRRAGILRGMRGETAGAWPGDYHPLAFWRHSKTQSDLLPYLRNNNIEPFEAIDGCKHGLSNDAKTILWLHDNHKKDYARWLEVFPLASAVVARREYFGIGRLEDAKECASPTETPSPATETVEIGT